MIESKFVFSLVTTRSYQQMQLSSCMYAWIPASQDVYTYCHANWRADPDIAYHARELHRSVASLLAYLRSSVRAHALRPAASGKGKQRQRQ